jgi:hypothetical protein
MLRICTREAFPLFAIGLLYVSAAGQRYPASTTQLKKNCLRKSASTGKEQIARKMLAAHPVHLKHSSFITKHSRKARKKSKN